MPTIASVTSLRSAFNSMVSPSKERMATYDNKSAAAPSRSGAGSDGCISHSKQDGDSECKNQHHGRQGSGTPSVLRALAHAITRPSTWKPALFRSNSHPSRSKSSQEHEIDSDCSSDSLDQCNDSAEQRQSSGGSLRQAATTPGATAQCDCTGVHLREGPVELGDGALGLQPEASVCSVCTETELEDITRQLW